MYPVHCSALHFQSSPSLGRRKSLFQVSRCPIFWVAGYKKNTNTQIQIQIWPFRLGAGQSSGWPDTKKNAKMQIEYSNVVPFRLDPSFGYPRLFSAPFARYLGFDFVVWNLNSASWELLRWCQSFLIGSSSRPGCIILLDKKSKYVASPAPWPQCLTLPRSSRICHLFCLFSSLPWTFPPHCIKFQQESLQKRKILVCSYDITWNQRRLTENHSCVPQSCHINWNHIIFPWDSFQTDKILEHRQKQMYVNGYISQWFHIGLLSIS